MKLSLLLAAALLLPTLAHADIASCTTIAMTAGGLEAPDAHTVVVIANCTHNAANGDTAGVKLGEKFTLSGFDGATVTTAQLQAAFKLQMIEVNALGRLKSVLASIPAGTVVDTTPPSAAALTALQQYQQAVAHAQRLDALVKLGVTNATAARDTRLGAINTSFNENLVP
jgi:hypothetical protein